LIYIYKKYLDVGLLTWFERDNIISNSSWDGF